MYDSFYFPPSRTWVHTYLPCLQQKKLPKILAEVGKSILKLCAIWCALIDRWLSEINSFDNKKCETRQPDHRGKENSKMSLNASRIQEWKWKHLLYTERVEWPEDEPSQQLILAQGPASLRYFLQVNSCPKRRWAESKLLLTRITEHKHRPSKQNCRERVKI